MVKKINKIRKNNKKRLNALASLVRYLLPPERSEGSEPVTK